MFNSLKRQHKERVRSLMSFTGVRCVFPAQNLKLSCNGESSDVKFGRTDCAVATWR